MGGQREVTLVIREGAMGTDGRLPGCALQLWLLTVNLLAPAPRHEVGDKKTEMKEGPGVCKEASRTPQASRGPGPLSWRGLLLSLC